MRNDDADILGGREGLLLSLSLRRIYLSSRINLSPPARSPAALFLYAVQSFTQPNHEF